MKKLLAVLFVIIASFSATAQQSFGIDDVWSNSPDKRIENAKIKAESMSEGQKMALFLKEKDDPIGPAAINFLFGLGIGSFMQGDTMGGAMLFGGSLLGGISLVVGYTGIARGDSSISYLVPLGYAILLADRIAEITTPITYSKTFNEKLSKAIFPEVSMETDPGNRLALGLTVSVPLN